MSDIDTDLVDIVHNYGRLSYKNGYKDGYLTGLLTGCFIGILGVFATKALQK
jgi:hypothetical protein